MQEKRESNERMFPTNEESVCGCFAEIRLYAMGLGTHFGWKQTPVSSLAAPRPAAFAHGSRYRIEVHAAEAVSSPLSIISLASHWETSAVMAV